MTDLQMLNMIRISNGQSGKLTAKNFDFSFQLHLSACNNGPTIGYGRLFSLKYTMF